MIIQFYVHFIQTFSTLQVFANVCSQPFVCVHQKRGGASLSLLSSPLLQTATNPHGHHLCISIVKLDDEGMILQKKKEKSFKKKQETFKTIVLEY